MQALVPIAASSLKAISGDMSVAPFSIRESAVRVTQDVWLLLLR